MISERSQINRDFLEIFPCVFESESYQCVFVDGLGPGQHPQSWPDLVQKVLANLQQSSHFPIPREFFEIHLVSVRVPNPFIELLPLHHQVTIARRHNAAPEVSMLAEEKVQQEKIFSKFGKSCG